MSLTRRNGGEPANPSNLQATVRLLRMLGYKFATVSQALASPFGRYACLTFDGAGHDFASAVVPCLERLGVPATLFAATMPMTGQPTWKQLRLLVAKGWEIGTLGHEVVDLTEKSSAEQRRLVSRARALLNQHLGLAPRVFAYPFGAYDATTVSCVKDEGFTAAVSLRSGINGAQLDAEALHLKRLPLSGHLFRDLVAIVRTALARVVEKAPHETQSNQSVPSATSSAL